MHGVSGLLAEVITAPSPSVIDTQSSLFLTNALAVMSVSSVREMKMKRRASDEEYAAYTPTLSFKKLKETKRGEKKEEDGEEEEANENEDEESQEQEETEKLATEEKTYKKEVVFVGSSPAFDIKCLKHTTPGLAQLLPPVAIDVSSLLILFSMLRPDLLLTKPMRSDHGRHSAQTDAYDSYILFCFFYNRVRAGFGTR